MRGSQGHVGHAVSPRHATAPRAAHRDATAELQIAVGPGHAKRGATCTYLKALQSTMHQLLLQQF